MELNMRVEERWIPAQPGRDMKKVMGRGKDLREGKKCRCQDFEKLPAFPFGPATASHHPRFVAISAPSIGDLVFN